MCTGKQTQRISYSFYVLTLYALHTLHSHHYTATGGVLYGVQSMHACICTGARWQYDLHSITSVHTIVRARNPGSSLLGRFCRGQKWKKRVKSPLFSLFGSQRVPWWTPFMAYIICCATVCQSYCHLAALMNMIMYPLNRCSGGPLKWPQKPKKDPF